MKKIRFLAVMLAFCMLFSLVACTNDEPSETTAETTEETTEETTDTTADDKKPKDDGEGEGEGDGTQTKYTWATQGGNGTAESPLIINQTNFKDFYEYYKLGGWNGFLANEDEHFKLGSDIIINEGDADDWGTTPPATVYDTPMAEFHGTLDGDGHSISGLYLKTAADGTHAALFQQIAIDGVVKNLSIENSYFEIGFSKGGGYFSAGSIAGRVYGGKIQNCYSDAIITCSVDGEGSFINYTMGGMAGMTIQDGGAVISNCVFAGEVSFVNENGYQGKLGGILGHSNWLNSGKTEINNCLVIGKMEGKNCAGIIGCSDGPTDITNCISMAESIKGNYTADFNAFNAAESFTVNSYMIERFTTRKVIGNNADGGEGKPYSGTVTSKTLNEFLTLNLEGWHYADGYLPTPIEGLQITVDGNDEQPTSWANQGGDGTKNSPYIINQNNFLAFYNHYIYGGAEAFANEYFSLESDVVINTGDATTWKTTAPSTTFDNPMSEFNGHFNGNGHTISGLYVKATSGYTALFHKMTGGSTVENLRIVNSYFEVPYTVNSIDAAGTITGWLEGGTISNCYSEAIVITSASGLKNYSMGGFVGILVSMNGTAVNTISNCVFAGQVTNGTTYRSGGIVGWAHSGNNNINNCLVVGTVNGSMSGGICGSSDSAVTITNCITLSNTISGTDEKIADMIGVNANESTTINSYLITDFGTGIVTTNKSYVGTVTQKTLNEFIALDLDGWYYANGYLPTPIEGLQLAIPQ